MAWLMVYGLVNAVPDFTLTTNVVNGFSDLIVELYGPEAGTHARMAPGIATLPGHSDATVGVTGHHRGGGGYQSLSFRELHTPEAQFPRISNTGSSVSENFPSRNCPKSLGRPYNVALRATEMVLLGRFGVRILAKSTVKTPLPTPFRTVSLDNRVNRGTGVIEYTH